jgi:glycogen operon protein
MFSLGMPMITMGDEVRRTQRGNNNAYCQDNETSWLDWTLLAKHADVHRFVKMLIEHRLLRDVQPDQHESLNQLIRESIKAWHGVKLYQPDWNNWSRSLALSVESKSEKEVLHLMLNAYWEPLEFELPPVSEQGGAWRQWVDTTLESPHDIVARKTAPPFTGRTYVVGPRSIVVLYAPLGASL